MTDREVKLIIGALLHDVGKVIYRQGDDRRKHSQSGCDYLKDEVGIDSREILDCVKYHHADALSKADIAEDDLAYLVYVADNIAAATDRRSSENEDVRFEKTMPLQSVFIVDNKRRVKFAKLLQGYGIRVQKSAFEAMLPIGKYEKLLGEIPRYINKKEDNVRVYKILGKSQMLSWGIMVS